MKDWIRLLNGAVRPLTALAFAGDVVYLSIRGDISPVDFLGLAGFVLGYWFRARDEEKKAG